MNEILTNLYIGDMTDGRDADRTLYAVLCVMWTGEPGISDTAMHIPTTSYEELSVRTHVENMERAARWIDHWWRLKRVLVHCAYGIERSPLTVVWYLMRYHRMTLDQAYELVLERRPQAQYRGTWLPQSVRLTGQLPPPGGAHAW